MEIFATAARIRLQDVPCVLCAGSPAPSSSYVKAVKLLPPVAVQDAAGFQKFLEVDAQAGAAGCGGFSDPRLSLLPPRCARDQRSGGPVR
jgi:hypothetical protein